MERTPLISQKIKKVKSWEMQREKTIRIYMDNAKQLLLNSGFPLDAVTVKIHERERGIARDIIREAQKAYSAIIIGRNGMSTCNDLVLGSVANKLINTLDFVSLWVIGDNTKRQKIMIAVDGSEGAMNAVNYIGSILGGSDLEIKLIHVIREENIVFIDTVESKIGPVFDEAKRRLIKSGFKPDKITTKIIANVHSRAGAVIEDARQEFYGTIVAGRRGISMVSDFSIGRVSSKVMHMTKKSAVWIVS